MQPVLDRPAMTGRTSKEIHNWLQLHLAIQQEATLTMVYHGGTDPGHPRNITPALIFHKISGDEVPPLYLLAWCHLRNAHRTFRLDRIELQSSTATATNPSHPFS
jgi:predicted DNA-binding transcriptional regulator YafY